MHLTMLAKSNQNHTKILSKLVPKSREKLPKSSPKLFQNRSRYRPKINFLNVWAAPGLREPSGAPLGCLRGCSWGRLGSLLDAKEGPWELQINPQTSP